MDPTDHFTVPLLDRAAKERRELAELAPFALKSAQSGGRRVPEGPDLLRTDFERDRDRIVHTTAFRRLMYKTQVFVNREGDHNRTRLSHSLEVAQVARSVGGALRLNDPLCEALALAHDIGHPPFGHRGEWALDRQMKDHGGFRHNAQVLRVIDILERRSPDYAGLNLTRETRESLLKHEKAEDWPEEFGPKPRHPYLEAQVVDLADSTAYNVHDVEDGLRAQMFSEADLEAGSRLWRESRERVEARHPGFLSNTADRQLRVKRISNELIKRCIEDLIEASAHAIAAAGLQQPDDARRRHEMTIGHSAELAPEVAELQQFLYRSFYRHPHLQRLTEYASDVIDVLFQAYLRAPQDLPPWYRSWIDQVGLERMVCDYVAGMTDRFAESEYERITGRRPFGPSGT
ncbi:deoxyguanosinetriphosphate triphosphohydrolase [Engelhardtia mirabilis]|uniref:Deoxyguanosinetriphosphate triphosphohydrolase-like protein n=1 Tax=Engelhardtia mirabilis TaxID=2528011 RepID=A0A518BRK2_9BACT|nr:Deoxyguanosinetriphosphate triphosphohydrolase [Planctomycetes bacterium Pla133]QDV03928.1 Deoxyguanosinetriphosphate triphosphohydrolase [Planctomycetes bacterium Pla86]